MWVVSLNTSVLSCYSDMHAKFEGQSLKYAWLDLVVGDFGEDGLGIHIQSNMTAKTTKGAWIRTNYLG